MTKKLMSLLLSIFIIMSFLGTSVVFANDNETEILGPGAEDKVLPEVAEGCNRYFFYMPKSWENEYSQTGRHCSRMIRNLITITWKAFTMAEKRQLHLKIWQTSLLPNRKMSENNC